MIVTAVRTWNLIQARFMRCNVIYLHIYIYIHIFIILILPCRIPQAHNYDSDKIVKLCVSQSVAERRFVELPQIVGQIYVLTLSYLKISGWNCWINVIKCLCSLSLGAHLYEEVQSPSFQLHVCVCVFLRWFVCITPNAGVLVMQKSVNMSTVANHGEVKLHWNQGEYFLIELCSKIYLNALVVFVTCPLSDIQ
jgi:hypothetical protein